MIRLGPLVLLIACTTPSPEYARLYASEVMAPSLSGDDLQTMDWMGARLVDHGVNVVVYSENATRLELLLFDDPESSLPTQQYELTRDGDLWSVYVEGVGVGQHYGFVAWGPNWTYDPEWFPGSPLGFLTDVDEGGNRFNPNKLLTDPYGKAIHRNHDWSRGSTASGPMRSQQTWAAGSKSVVTRSDYAWSDNEAEWRAARKSGNHEGHDWSDLILYEVHAKGFTKNPASGVDHPGTFRGFGEAAGYLADLGINAVELLPVHHKQSLTGGYWGYSNLSFFTLEPTYSWDQQVTGRPETAVDEFKWMVDQLHQQGIEVIIDVVYNHTGEGGLWRERLYFESYDQAFDVNFDPKEIAGIYNFRGLDNAAYYANSEDGQYYVNNTGVGNQTRPNHTPFKRLTMDSLRWMAEELHVDGFRFDLAGILGEKDLDYFAPIDPRETILQEIIDDPVLVELHTRVIAEPWTATGTGPGIGGYPLSTVDPAVGWGEWNAAFRVWWRAFFNNCNWSDAGNECRGAEGDHHWFLDTQEIGVDGGGALTGSEALYGWNGRRPYHAVNYLTVHDGLTLFDVFSYDEKQNGCGLLNPVCCDEPLSVWCNDDEGENENRSRNVYDEDLKRQLIRNSFVALLVSHGTPLIYGGDEWMRTKFGNNNTWTSQSDNEWQWFRWGEWQSSYAWERHRMHDFVRGMTRLRSEHPGAFSPSTYGGGMPIVWRDASGAEKSDWHNRHVMVHYTSGGEVDENELLLLINGEAGSVDFNLPAGRTWHRLVDTQSYFDTPANQGEAGGFFDDNPAADTFLSANIELDDPVALTSSVYTAVGQTMVILEAR